MIITTETAIKMLKNSIGSMTITKMNLKNKSDIKYADDYIEALQFAVKCIEKFEEEQNDDNN